MKDSNLIEIKPDIRHFGFNAPNPMDESGYHGYEMWVTIPDDFEVPAPLVKKRMEGGMYCAHMIPIGAFDEWALLADWLNNDNDKYEFRGVGSPDNMFDSLEECLNYINHVDGDWGNVQLDLLIPIKKYEAITFPHELTLPLNDADWKYWSFASKRLEKAKRMVVEYDGAITGGYSFVRHNPSPWVQYDNGNDKITDDGSRIVFDLDGTDGNVLGFATWSKGEYTKVKRVYLEGEN